MTGIPALQRTPTFLSSNFRLLTTSFTKKSTLLGSRRVTGPRIGLLSTS
ncbi:hypothetical protein WG66_002529, partial [Moniliophthora roreri]